LLFENVAYQYRMRLKLKEFQVKRFYEKKLRKKVFVVIKHNYDEALQAKMIVQKAEKFAMLWLKRRVFSDWSDKLESKNEMKSMHIVYKARRHYEKRLVHNCVKQWVEFIAEQRKLNEKIKRADDFRRKNLLKNYVQKMAFYVELVKYKRASYKQALEFEKDSVYAKFFIFWVNKYEITIESQMNTRIVIALF
jgi:hypothetical protein